MHAPYLGFSITVGFSVTVGFFVTGAVGFSVVVTRAVGVFSVIGGVQSCLDFFLSGSISSAERLIPLTGFHEKDLTDVYPANFPADQILHEFLLGFVSAVWFHCFYKKNCMVESNLGKT